MQQCRKHLQRQVSPFDVAGLAAEKEELEKKMGAPDFWDDVEAANKANQRMKTISAKLEKYNKLRGLLEDAEVMADMAEEGDDQEMADELGIKQRTVSDDIKKIRSLVQPLAKDIFNR